MIAKQLQINEFLQTPNVQFVIPVYQRNYDWGNSECKVLLNDIISVGAKNEGSHFIGSIVFIHEGVFMVGEVKELVIIDGQQRLTTINILYVALLYQIFLQLECLLNCLYHAYFHNNFHLQVVIFLINKLFVLEMIHEKKN